MSAAMADLERWREMDKVRWLCAMVARTRTSERNR